MNISLFKLIQDYQLAVREAVEMIVQSGIPKPSTSTEWVETDIIQRGKLINGVRYFKHGFGCAVNLPSGKVDFDFGVEGQIDGFDLWKLTEFVDGRLRKYGFATKRALKIEFDDAIKSGQILKSDYVLCYIANKHK